MPSEGLPIAVLGAGSWGTALSVSLCGSGHAVTLWARRPQAAAAMRRTRHNPMYLPDVVLPDGVVITADLERAASAARLWVVATPSHAVRSLAERILPFAAADHLVISVAKGIEEDSMLTTSQVLESVLAPAVPSARIGVLYGPSHAEEVAEGKPTTIVAAAGSMDTAEFVQSVFMTGRLRVYVNEDILGVEIGGSVKNVMAIATGISDGIGYGVNARAALMTRGMAEIQRLGVAMGARPSTFAGLTGIGDLVVTCTSDLSRNRRAGKLIGQGFSPSEAQARLQMVAEGIRTTAAVRSLARRYGIEMPITEAVYDILFNGKKPEDAVRDLMSRSAKVEEWLDEEATKELAP